MGVEAVRNFIVQKGAGVEILVGGRGVRKIVDGVRVGGWEGRLSVGRNVHPTGYSAHIFDRTLKF